MKKSVWVTAFFFLVIMGGPTLGYSKGTEKVTGKGCASTLTDEKRVAREKAKKMAQEDAVKAHSVWAESLTGIKYIEMEKQILEYVSRYFFKTVKQEPTETEADKICITMHGEINGELIQQHAKRLTQQNDIIQVVDNPDANPPSDFKLDVWLDQVDGRYMEGETLTVFVKSSENAFLLLDYYQSDNTVVHMVPNLFLEKEEFELKAGQTYTFGGANADYEFKITEPFGFERIKGIASTQPFSENMKTEKRQSPGKEYAKLQLRGLQVLAKKRTEAKNMQMAVANIKVYTEGKSHSPETPTPIRPDLTM